MAECECGAVVSARYFRVFSIDGELNGCQHCEQKNRHGPQFA